MGAGIAATCEVVGLVAQGEPSTALVLAMHYIYHAVGRRAPWNPDAHAFLCRESLEGIALINHLRAEPELGTPARGGLPATTAVRTASGWRISGHKILRDRQPAPQIRPRLGQDRTAPTRRWASSLCRWRRRAPASSRRGTTSACAPRAATTSSWRMSSCRPNSRCDLRTPQEWLGRPRSRPGDAGTTSCCSALYNGIAVAARDWLARYLHERQPSNLGASLATAAAHAVGRGRNRSAPLHERAPHRRPRARYRRRRGRCPRAPPRSRNTPSRTTPCAPSISRSPWLATPAFRAQTTSNGTTGTCSAAASTCRKTIWCCSARAGSHSASPKRRTPVTIEFIGMIGTRSASELDGPTANLIGGHIDAPFVPRVRAGPRRRRLRPRPRRLRLDRPGQLRRRLLRRSVTDRLGFLIAHRPGFVAPTLAARKAATLDQFSNGRVALHIITGGNDAEQQRDGDFLDHDARYRRTDEYLDIVRKTWTEPRALRLRRRVLPGSKAHLRGEAAPAAAPARSTSAACPARRSRSARSTPTCTRCGASRVASIKEQIAAVRAEAAKHGRSPRFSVSFRPIIARHRGAGLGEGPRLPRPHRLAAQARERRRRTRRTSRRPSAPSACSSSPTAAKSTTSASGRRSPRPSAPTATPPRSSARRSRSPSRCSLLRRRRHDAPHPRLRTPPDASEYGRELIPLVRAEVAKRDRAALAAR